MKYKALICDVDGTLITHEAESLPSNTIRKSIEKISGTIYVGIATGRPYSLAMPIIRTLKLSAPCIITGGAQLIDPVTKKIISEKILSKDKVYEVYDAAQKYAIPLRIADNDRDLLMSDSVELVKPFDLYTNPLSLENAHTFMQKISHISNVAVHRIPAWENETDHKVHVVISHPEATKQHGILEVANILGIKTHEMIGIGEGYNDFPLLMACGFKVAMGNAVTDLKEIADYIAPTVDNDGVAHVIEKFIL